MMFGRRYRSISWGQNRGYVPEHQPKVVVKGLKFINSVFEAQKKGMMAKKVVGSSP